ncbi:hypothetical protein BV22DRAFT_1036217 [Leucogyrophana mollusca]|uniref:Uncharacterized protein n=1 Tax=Leucogyrophana mollusca TaxID=85980 RepID=A0ACB8BDD4_9AGAM|nr:hypothetical protein BV22DRAFT_1036217 [Leucogyrophana mollusca]
MQNAFIIIRTIFLSLMAYLNLLSLIFASWNIAASKSSGSTAPGAAVFLVLNSALIFVFVFLASVADFICSKSRPAQVKFECGWTVLMSALQLAASIDVTVNGPPVLCHIKATWTTCASASLLVPVSWLSTFVLLTYCLTLIVMSVTHANEYPAIWSTSVQAVPWFTEGDLSLKSTASPETSIRTLSRKPSASSIASQESCAVTRYIQERWEKLSGIESQAIPSHPILFSRDRLSVDSRRPSWAQKVQTRRGVDQPFARRPAPPVSMQPIVLSSPPKARPREVSAPRDSNYAEICRESDAHARNSRSTLPPQTPTAFPPRIADPDLPIPLPRLSEWIRADAAKGITVHTVPPISP